MAYSKVDELFWNDPLVRALPERARQFFLYLLTSPHRNRLGCYMLDLWYASADLQWPQEMVASAMRELVEADRVAWDAVNRVVFVKRFLRHNTLENRNVVLGATTELKKLPDTPLLPDLLASLKENSKPHYRVLIEALTNRLANGSANDSPNGMPNPPVKATAKATATVLLLPSPQPTPPGEEPGQDQPRRVADVENSGEGPGQPPANGVPEGRPYADPPAYTRGELLEEAKAECGLGTWSTPEVTSAQSVLTTWYGAGETPERIHAAIVGARQLVDNGEVDWLKVRQPYGLKALNNTCAVVHMGDGRTQRLLYEAAVETYYRALDSPAPAGKRGKGPKTTAELLAAKAR